MNEVQLLIGGKNVPATNAATFERSSPVTGKPVSRSAAASAADARAACDAAAAAFPAWSSQGPNARRKLLLTAAQILRARSADFARLCTEETGAIAGWGHFNTGFAATLLEEAAAMTTQITGETVPSDHAGTLAMAGGELTDNADLAHLAQELPEQADLLESNDEAPIIRLINALLSQAIRDNASDIHIETFESRLVVRLRVDGVLREVLQTRRLVAPLVVSRIKVMSRLDIAEKRLPQDGRISLRIAGRAVDVRVSTIPTGHGERVVLRILDKQAGRLDLTSLGMDARTLTQIDELIHKRNRDIWIWRDWPAEFRDVDSPEVAQFAQQLRKAGVAGVTDDADLNHPATASLSCSARTRSAMPAASKPHMASCRARAACSM